MDISRQIAEDGMILQIIAGSTGYGLNTPTSDTDYMGVCLTPEQTFFGFGQPGSTFEQLVESDPLNDRQVHSLKKFLTLMMKGNPTILNLIFSSEEFVVTNTPIGRLLRMPEIYEKLISANAENAFYGYMADQVKMLEKHGTGEALSRIKRPELVEQYGFDTKYAMHAMRLGMMGVELLNTGRITMPMAVGDVEYLMNVRGGNVSFGNVMVVAERLTQQLSVLKGHSVLVPEANKDLAMRILRTAQEEFWIEGAVSSFTADNILDMVRSGD
jgi:predicted nucleotidyltransferase